MEKKEEKAPKKEAKKEEKAGMKETKGNTPAPKKDLTKQNKPKDPKHEEPKAIAAGKG